MEVKLIRQQGKSISSYKFDTKGEAVFFITSLGQYPQDYSVQKIRKQRCYLVNLKK